MYCFDRESRLFVRDKAGVSLPIGDRPIVAYGDQVTLTLKQVDATGAAVPLPPGATYSVVLAKGYTNLLVYSESVTAAESGEITLIIHCNTPAFLEAITEKTNIIFELVEYTLDNTLGRVILGDTIRATPRATPGSVPLPDPEEPSAYTKAQIDALINGLRAELTVATQVIEVALLPEEINSEGVWEKTFAELGITGRRVVQLVNSDGMICTEDALILIKWTDTGLRVDFGSNIPDSAYTLIM